MPVSVSIVRRRSVRIATLAIATLGLAAFTAYEMNAASAKPAPVIPPATHAPYAAQKVVYHLTGGGGFFGRDFGRFVGNMENHVRALDGSRLDLVVVMNGDGVGLLEQATSDPALAKRIDGLRAKGVKFLLCRNTLVNRKLDPASLHGFTVADLVPSGVAEVTDLAQKGFMYLRP